MPWHVMPWGWLVPAGLLVAAVVMAAPAPAAAAPADLPPPGAAACSGCHGGVAPLPPLAGRPAPEIEAALAAFRDGTREATVMNRLARGLTEAQSAAIAVWWAGQGVGEGK